MSVSVVHPVMAGLTEGYKVPGFKSVLWIVFNREDVVDVFTGPHLSVAPALLALIVVSLKDAAPHVFPFG